MPKEKVKRGRREQKKRKRQEADDSGADARKQRKLIDDEASEMEVKLDDTALDFTTTAVYEPAWHSRKEAQFYGLLDDEEQSYFKRADQMLELDQFTDPEERDLFLESLWRELNGKELKVACSQSCSRLLERLIGLSSTKDLKGLHQKFSGHLLGLMQHRFASHCCEALLFQSAPIVTDELVAEPDHMPRQAGNTDDDVPMADHFLGAVSELEQDVGFLMTDQFGSHTLRVLLLALSGRPLKDATALSTVQSKNKETITTAMGSNRTHDRVLTHRSVPASFSKALEQVKMGLVGPLDTGSLRTLSTQPLASPVLQLLLDIELSDGSKQTVKSPESVYRKLLPETLVECDTLSGSYVQGLLYDPVGSHLLEILVRCAPGKAFKAIHRNIMQPNLSAIARNNIAVHVLVQVLERLSADDLRQAVEQLSGEVRRLIEQAQTSLIRCLIDRCRMRNVDTDKLAQEIRGCYGSDSSALLPRLLLHETSDQLPMLQAMTKEQLASHERKKTHASLLAQSMLKSPGSLSGMITESALTTERSNIIGLAKDRSATHCIQALVQNSESSHIFRRKLITRFLGSVAVMAVDANASHVVDTLWAATSDLHFLREKIAEEMAVAEAEIKSSFVGRAVWRNWMMDTFKRHKGAWIAKGRAADESHVAQASPPQLSKAKEHKRAIDLARERFAKGRMGMKPPTSKLEKRPQMAPTAALRY